MPADPAAAELVGRKAAEELLSAGEAQLPPSLGRPVPLPHADGRSPLVVIGVVLAALTLIGGLALGVVGVVGLLAGHGAAAAAELVAGLVLCGTHWGWVHVTVAGHDALERHRHRELHARRQHWLEAIEPYPRYEVTTEAQPDGAIAIVMLRYRPQPVGRQHFTFVRDRLEAELQPPESSAAAVAERTEVRRREAAARTERERVRLLEVADAELTRKLAQTDDEQERQALRAGSQALSEQLNTRLRDPPLTE